MKTVRISGKHIGDGYPCFIVFEAGPSHNGIDSACELVRRAAAAGADAIKFQMIDPDRLVADRNQEISYDILLDRHSGETRTVSEPLYRILKRRCLTKDEWRALKHLCDEMGIIFFATASFFDEIDFLVELGCRTLKICSGDIDYYQLIEYSASTGMCLQFDSSNATIGDIERAVEVACGAGCKDIIIHNCPSGYPARLESINLRLISTLKQVFQYPVAFSDHSVGMDMDIAAVALGANMVEKTITLDRTTASPEHLFSLESEEMATFVRTIRNVEVALGGPRRILDDVECKRSLAVRRSLVAARDLSAGERVSAQTTHFARPGIGLRPELFSLIEGRQLKRDVKCGQMITLDDVI
ncbi:MAG: N-acetylneuraminate synthase family protein [Deltaproteobacteria bacterium]|nr:N-acetylneuraminate synthase family protein [Deltaproteobacteria bacterium]MBW2152328.1 N-acetylneuraminate synthase family protein [Deltaproteobacteria bacterium]